MTHFKNFESHHGPYLQNKACKTTDDWQMNEEYTENIINAHVCFRTCTYLSIYTHRNIKADKQPQHVEAWYVFTRPSTEYNTDWAMEQKYSSSHAELQT